MCETCCCDSRLELELTLLCCWCHATFSVWLQGKTSPRHAECANLGKLNFHRARRMYVHATATSVGGLHKSTMGIKICTHSRMNINRSAIRCTGNETGNRTRTGRLHGAFSRVVDSVTHPPGSTRRKKHTHVIHGSGARTRFAGGLRGISDVQFVYEKIIERAWQRTSTALHAELFPWQSPSAASSRVLARAPVPVPRVNANPFRVK